MTPKSVLVVDGLPHPRRAGTTPSHGLTVFEEGPEDAARRLHGALAWVLGKEGPSTNLAVMADEKALESLERASLPFASLRILPWNPRDLHVDPERIARQPLAWGEAYDCIYLLHGGNLHLETLSAERLVLSLTARRKILLEPSGPLAPPPLLSGNWKRFRDLAERLGAAPAFRDRPVELLPLLGKELRALAREGLLRLDGLCRATMLMLLLPLMALMARAKAAFFARAPIPDELRDAFDEALWIWGPRPARVLRGALEAHHLRQLDLPSPRVALAPFDDEELALPFGRGGLDLGLTSLPHSFDGRAQASGVFENLAAGSRSELPLRPGRVGSFLLPSFAENLPDGEELALAGIASLRPDGRLVLLAAAGSTRLPPRRGLGRWLAGLGLSAPAPPSLCLGRWEWENWLRRHGMRLRQLRLFEEPEWSPCLPFLDWLDGGGGGKLLGGLPAGSPLRRGLNACIRCLFLPAFCREARTPQIRKGRRCLVVAEHASGHARPPSTPDRRKSWFLDEVASPAALELFLEIPESLHGPEARPPAHRLRALRDFFAPRSSPLAAPEDMLLLLAHHDDRPIGGLAVMIDETQMPGLGLFACFDALPLEGLASTLLEAGQAWLEERGARSMLGPVTPRAEAGEMGLRRPAFTIASLPPSSEPLLRSLEDAGFRKRAATVPRGPVSGDGPLWERVLRGDE